MRNGLLISALLWTLLLLAVTKASSGDFAYCKNITIQNPTGTTLTNHPVPINITYTSNMQTDFDDIEFYSAACESGGIKLYAELETKTNSTSAYAWINHTMPAAGTTIAMYYGNASKTYAWDTLGNVWKNYRAVWHLSEAGGTGITIHDSTTTYNGTSEGNPTSTTMLAGTAYNFDGVGDRINFGDVLDWGTTDFTWEAVFNTSETTNAYLLSKYESANDRFYLRKRDDASKDVAQFYGVEAAAPLGAPRSDETYPLTTVTKYYLVLTCDRGSEGEWYINGALRKDDAFHGCEGSAANINAAGNLLMAGYNGDDSAVIIDEMRIYDGLLSAQQINATYNYIFLQGATVTFGAEQTLIEDEEPDECTYPGSGNWTAPCNCTFDVDNNTDMANNAITFNGTGTTTIYTAYLTNYTYMAAKGVNSTSRCTVNIYTT